MVLRWTDVLYRTHISILSSCLANSDDFNKSLYAAVEGFSHSQPSPTSLVLENLYRVSVGHV